MARMILLLVCFVAARGQDDWLAPNPDVDFSSEVCCFPDTFLITGTLNLTRTHDASASKKESASGPVTFWADFLNRRFSFNVSLSPMHELNGKIVSKADIEVNLAVDASKDVSSQLAVVMYKVKVAGIKSQTRCIAYPIFGYERLADYKCISRKIFKEKSVIAGSYFMDPNAMPENINGFDISHSTFYDIDLCTPHMVSIGMKRGAELIDIKFNDKTDPSEDISALPNPISSDMYDNISRGECTEEAEIAVPEFASFDFKHLVRTMIQQFLQ